MNGSNGPLGKAKKQYQPRGKSNNTVFILFLPFHFVFSIYLGVLIMKSSMKSSGLSRTSKAGGNKNYQFKDLEEIFLGKSEDILIGKCEK